MKKFIIILIFVISSFFSNLSETIGVSNICSSSDKNFLNERTNFSLYNKSLYSLFDGKYEIEIISMVPKEKEQELYFFLIGYINKLENKKDEGKISLVVDSGGNDEEFKISVVKNTKETASSLYV